jgi:DNA-binding LacI/PurR family transcriptional regulator
MRGTLNPTAFVCSSDILALGVNAGPQSIGLRMGDEIVATGYDDEPVAEYLGLTSLRQPTDLLGAKVVDLLMAQIGKEKIAAQKILLEPECRFDSIQPRPVRAVDTSAPVWFSPSASEPLWRVVQLVGHRP